MVSPNAPLLPTELAQLMGRVVGALAAAESSKVELNPYATAYIEEGTRTVTDWLESVRVEGSTQGLEQVLKLLRALDAEALALVRGESSFDEHLRAHLKALRQTLKAAVAARELTKELGTAFVRQIRALETRALKRREGEMAALRTRALGIELAVHKSMTAGREGRMQARILQIRA